MCGRFAQFVSKKKIIEELKIKKITGEIQPEFNFSPGSGIAVIRRKNNETSLQKLHWDLIPSYSKSLKNKYKLYNIRIESLLAKNNFRQYLQTGRCLIPASGFYEWSKKKNAYYFYPENNLKNIALSDSCFLFAGIWDSWESPEEKRIDSCAILTKEAILPVKKIHSRMPVILSAKNCRIWLEENSKISELEIILKQNSPDTINYHPVSSIVNNAGINSPECIKPYYSNDLFPETESY